MSHVLSIYFVYNSSSQPLCISTHFSCHLFKNSVIPTFSIFYRPIEHYWWPRIRSWPYGWEPLVYNICLYFYYSCVGPYMYNTKLYKYVLYKFINFFFLNKYIQYKTGRNISQIIINVFLNNAIQISQIKIWLSPLLPIFLKFGWK